MKIFLKKIFTWDNFFTLICGFFFLIFLIEKNNGVTLFSKGIVITTLIFSVILILAKKFLFKNKKPFFKYILYFMYMFVFAGFLFFVNEFYIYEAKEKSHIAFTKDIELAKEIQKLDKDISIEKASPNNEYGLKLRYGNRDKIILKLAENYQNNDNLHIIPELIYYDEKHPEKYPKKLEKSTERIFTKIEGVKTANVKILNFNKDDRIPQVSIDLTILRGYDEKKIEKIIKNLCHYKTDLKLNINYEIDDKYSVYWRYKERIFDLYSSKKYDEMNKLIDEVGSVLGDKKKEDIIFAIEKEKKWDELTKKIEKSPNNFKYYIERGELEHGKEKVKDLKKALSLNPGYKHKDYLNFEIAEEYYHAGFYDKALEYYKKIENEENIYKYFDEKEKTLSYDKKQLIKSKPVPPIMQKEGNPFWLISIINPHIAPIIYISKLSFDKEQQKLKNSKKKLTQWERIPWSSSLAVILSNKNFLQYRIYECQKNLKLYEEAYKTCKKQAEISEKNGENPYYIYKDMIRLDIKMKNFKQAWIDDKKKNQYLK